MAAGIKAGVHFEVACGGNAECCTCHIKLEPSVIKNQLYVGPDSKEIDALDFAVGTDENSRLACQVKLSEAFEDSKIRFVANWPQTFLLIL